VLRLAVLLLLATCALPAEVLRFEQRRIELKPAADATSADAIFRFTNASDRAVTITGTQSACACVVAELARKVFQPGEQGEITVLYTVGDLGGRQEKQIIVATDHPDEPSATLTLAIDLPPLPVPQPAFVTWTRGAAPEPRQVFIAIPEGSSMRLTEARPSLKSVTAVLSEAAGGKAWLLTLTPTDTSALTNVMVELRSNGPRKLYIFASVVE
jgi:hypothetical protein